MLSGENKCIERKHQQKVDPKSGVGDPSFPVGCGSCDSYLLMRVMVSPGMSNDQFLFSTHPDIITFPDERVSSEQVT